MYLIRISLFNPKDLNWKLVSIGSDDGLTANRRQAIAWTNAGQVYWRIYA